MRRFVVGALLFGAILPAAPPTLAQREDPPKAAAKAAAEKDVRDAQAVAAKIDALIAARWKEKNAVPAAPADDAEFVRRAYLDLTGRIPDILEARDFLDNPAKDKRAQLVSRLLDSERYPVHFANVWRALLLPDGDNQNLVGFRPGIEAWLRNELKNNTPYDKMVREIVTGGSGGRAGNLAGFYQANNFLPENLAASTARLFLGVKIECAQCHNHPFARWTRTQFWEQAAFFAGTQPRGIRPRPGLELPVAKLREIKIPGTDKTVKARFLDGTAPRWADGVDPRETLADWMTRADNPYFARAAANRMWEYFLGTGLVDPVDEGGPDNPPSHPEVLDELAKQFAAHKFDLKFLARTIMATRAYQLTSRASHPSQADARLFARMKVRGLSPEQLYDSLALATGNADDEQPGVNPGRGFGRPGPLGPRAEFLRRFPNQDKRTEQQTSILQALYLMNGKLVADATSLEHNKNLAIIAEARSVRTPRRVEQLYLITLSRKPRPAELARLVRYVDRGGPSGDTGKALCDVFWALLNSSEFCVNH
jgi:hypothetical protein